MSTIAWVVTCIAIAALQGIRFGSEPLPHAGVLCSLLCGVSLGALLFPAVCWLPVLTRSQRVRRIDVSGNLGWLMVAWFVWCGALLVSVLANGGSGVGFRALAKAVLLGVSFLGLATWLAGVSEARRSLTVASGVFWSLVLLAGLGVLEMVFPRLWLFEVFRTESSRSIFPRIAGIMTWPNAYALVLVVGLILGCVLLSGPSGRRGRTCVHLGHGLLLVQLAASGSRNGWMTFLLASLALWVFGRTRRQQVVGVMLLALLAVLLPVSARQVGLSAPVAPALVGWLPTSTLSEQERTAVEEAHPTSESMVGDPRETSAASSLASRKKIWAAAVRALRDRPIAGIGAGSFESKVGARIGGRSGFNAHSLPLNIAAETGALGILASFLVAIAFLRPCVLVRKSTVGAGPRPIYWWVAFGALGVGQLVDSVTYDGVVVAVWCIVAAQVWVACNERHYGETRADNPIIQR